MNNAELERLRTLAGTVQAKKEDLGPNNPSDNGKTVQQIMETYVPVVEGGDDEKAKRRAFDKADDEAGKKKVSLKKAPWEESIEESDDEELEESDDEEKLEESDDEELEEADKPDFADIDDDGDKEETAKKAAKDKKEMTEQEQMREWSNSVYKQYDDRGHYQEQPEGETVDLSLRRYLNATPQKVTVAEDIKPGALAKAYKSFKGKK